MRLGDMPGFSALLGDIGDPALVTRFSREQLDTVVAVNVLEHIRDDVSALRHVACILSSLGRVILLVPALPLLYGTMDEADGHYRRYTLRGLVHKLQASGLKAVRMFYFNILGVLGWFVNGRVFQRRYVPERQLMAYDISPSL